MMEGLCKYILPIGYLKAQNFKYRLQTTKEMKDFIRHELATIPEAMTWLELLNFRVRLRECVVDDDKDLESTIFEKNYMPFCLIISLF